MEFRVEICFFRDRDFSIRGIGKWYSILFGNQVKVIFENIIESDIGTLIKLNNWTIKEKLKLSFRIETHPSTLL